MMKNEKLIFVIEKPAWIDTPLAKAIDIIGYAVGTFNSEVDRSPYSTGKDSWGAYLTAIIRFNKEAFDYIETDQEVLHDRFIWGFSGSHFYLHDLMGERVVMVYLA